MHEVYDAPGFFGIIADQPRETDYQLLAGTLDLPWAMGGFNFRRIQYDQKEINAFSCTLHGAIGALSDLTGYTFSVDERKEILGIAVSKGFDLNRGWYIANAVDVVRNFWNSKHPDQQVITFRVEVGSQEFFNALKQNYSVVFGYNGNGKYQSDFQDGKLDKTEFGKSTYGHCIRIADLPDIGTAIDNYFKRLDVNAYYLPESNIETLLRNGVFQRSGYVFVLKEHFDNHNKTMPQIPVWAIGSVNKAANKGLMHPADIDDQMTIGKIEDDLIKLGIFNDKLGTIDEKRWAVALDRMKQL